MSRPAEDGFFMPAEWTPHSRCWMEWPCRVETWGDRIEAARDAYAEVATAIARFEPVTMITSSPGCAAASPGTATPISMVDASSADLFIRCDKVDLQFLI